MDRHPECVTECQTATYKGYPACQGDCDLRLAIARRTRPLAQAAVSIADKIPQWFEGGTTKQMLDEAYAQIRLLENSLAASPAAGNQEGDAMRAQKLADEIMEQARKGNPSESWTPLAENVRYAFRRVVELEEEIRTLRSAAGNQDTVAQGGVSVFFYEHDFYVLSNFSSFRLQWMGQDFDTSEHAYHWEKFRGASTVHQNHIRHARSAHEAFKYAEQHKADRRSDWDAVKVDVMRALIKAKAEQHEYVMRKLLATGERRLIEDSWRDDYWGWGPNKDGKNMLGNLWMELRAALRSPPSGRR